MKEYTTPDLALAATLSQLGHKILKLEKMKAGKYAFVFEQTAELDKSISLYWASELRLEPRAYFEQIKSIKTRMYDFRANDSEKFPS